MNDNPHQYLLDYLKSGGWGGHRLKPSTTQITLGPKTFPSIYAARHYIRRIMGFCAPGQEIVGDDALMLRDLVKRYPYYKTGIEPHGILGFTVKDHCGSKILVVLLAAATPVKRTYNGYVQGGKLMTCDVSIDRCLGIDRKEVAPVTKRVIRQDSMDDMDEAA